MSTVGVQSISGREQAMPDHPTAQVRLDEVVSTVEEFDRIVSQNLPVLLDRAAGYTKRFLRETRQWSDDVAHEKFILRWAAEYLEQFLVTGRSEVPCRPLFLLDSMVAKQHSKPEPFCYHPDLLTPLGRFIDGLIGRGTVSRDALIVLFHHCYGLGPGEVISLLSLNGSESQRIYKNFRRWRESGWRRLIDEMGLDDADVEGLSNQQQHYRHRFNSEAERLIRLAQTHYRKSEPEHFACPPRSQWEEMFAEGYGSEYRIWHLALCLDCAQVAWGIGCKGESADKLRVELHLRP